MKGHSGPYSLIAASIVLCWLVGEILYDFLGLEAQPIHALWRMLLVWFLGAIVVLTEEFLRHRPPRYSGRERDQ